MHRLLCTGCSAALLLATSLSARAEPPPIRWIWSGQANARIDLSPGSGARFGRTQRRVTYDDAPDTPWTEVQAVGICRVKFDGVESIGTVRRGNTRGRVYRWSNEVGRYVETRHAGQGQTCHVRLSSPMTTSDTGVGTFQQFEYLDAPQHTLIRQAADEPRAPLRLGTRHGRPLFACRVERRYDQPKDTTLGRKTYRRDTVWGYAVEGKTGCTVPDVASRQTVGVHLLAR